VLEDKNVTAIAIAAPITAPSGDDLGCEHGKHVYCEKPVSHNLVEGRAWSKLANGTIELCKSASAPQRPHFRRGRADPHGRLADPLRRACIAATPNIGTSRTAPRQGVDTICSPAPERRSRKRFHYNGTGTGLRHRRIGNNGITASTGRGCSTSTLQLASAPARQLFYDETKRGYPHRVFDFPNTTVWEHRVCRAPASTAGVSRALRERGT